MNRIIEVKSMHRERERERRETKDEKDNTSGDS
jgi:hypothetical protein